MALPLSEDASPKTHAIMRCPVLLVTQRMIYDTFLPVGKVALMQEG